MRNDTWCQQNFEIFFLLYFFYCILWNILKQRDMVKCRINCICTVPYLPKDEGMHVFISQLTLRKVKNAHILPLSYFPVFSGIVSQNENSSRFRIFLRKNHLHIVFLYSKKIAHLLLVSSRKLHRCSYKAFSTKTSSIPTDKAHLSEWTRIPYKRYPCAIRFRIFARHFKDDAKLKMPICVGNRKCLSFVQLHQPRKKQRRIVVCQLSWECQTKCTTTKLNSA